MSCSYSCDNSDDDVLAYADISGPGVVAGFAGTALMVVFFLLVYYVFVFDPKLDPFRAPDDNASRASYINFVDDFTLSTIRTFVYSKLQRLRLFRWTTRYGERKGGSLKDTFNKCTLVLADMQIINGLAILISGFSSIKCGLSSYHWQIIVYLAWLSSITHLSTLTFLRSYLYSHPAEYFSRLVLMLALIALFCVALMPTAFFDVERYTDPEHGFRVDIYFPLSYPVICFYGRRMDTNSWAFQSMIIFLLLSVYGYAIRVAKLSNWTMTRSHKIMTYFNTSFNRQVELWQPFNSPQSTYVTLREVVMRPLYLSLLGVTTIQLNLFGSVFAEVYWLVISLSWGILNLFTIRNSGPTSENNWTFGQILPMIMLAAPLFSILKNLIESLYLSEKLETASISRQRMMEDQQHSNSKPHQPLDISQTVFNGSFTLAICSYLYYGLYIFIDPPWDISGPLQYLPVEALLYQPLIQMVWLVYTLWLEKFDWPPPIQSYFRRLLLSSLLALSFISFFFIGDYQSEGYAALVMMGTYLFIACLWITCELRITESPLKVRLFIRFLFSSVVFGAATLGYFIYSLPNELQNFVRDSLSSSYITPHLYILLIYIMIFLSSFGVLFYEKAPIISKISGLLIFPLIITCLFLNDYLLFRFWDTIHLLIAIVSINAFPYFIFTIYVLVRDIFGLSSREN